MAVNNYEPLSPEWWVERLYAALQDQRDSFERHDRYYRGDFPLPWLAPQAAEDFRRILSMTRSNFMGLVIDSMVERISIEGFRIGDDPAADSEVWRIWQANNMDSAFDQGLLESAIGGESYLLVEPNSTDRRTPKIHVEHPTQCIVEHVPGSNRRETAAGLKAWEDDLTGKIFATLYLPKMIYRFQADKPRVVRGRRKRMEWTPRDGARFKGRNPLGEVPLYELPNNPRLLEGGVSEISDVMDVQDRIVKTIADRLMTQDYGAFPQKWATAWPEEDASGHPTPPIQIGRNRMVTTEVAETKFGQWDAAEIGGYVGAKAEDVKDIASRTRTPAQYLLGEMSNVNGETLKASESGLVSKVRQRCKGYSDPVERAVRAVRRLAGITAETDEVVETIWRNPEFRTEGELVDALFKLGSPPINMPRVVVWEKWGATPTEIERWEGLMREQRRADDVMAAMTERYKIMATQCLVGTEDTAGGGGQPGANRPNPNAQAARGGGRGGGGRRQTRDTDGDGIVGEGRNGNDL